MRKCAATVLKPPTSLEKLEATKFSIFLAGAIDMGEAVDWQTELTKKLDDLDILILNPRRDDWDSSWEQKADNPEFRGQVLWEVHAMEMADLIVYVFTKDSKAPITFFELGKFISEKDVIVCAEEGFYRQGNLDIYCDHWEVPIYHNLDEMAADLHDLLEKRNAV
jgi:hypothetical protein